MTTDPDATPLDQDVRALGPLLSPLFGDRAATLANTGDFGGLARTLGVGYELQHASLASMLASWRPMMSQAAPREKSADLLAAWESRAAAVSRQQAVARAESILRRAAAGVATGLPYDAVTPAVTAPAYQPPIFTPDGTELIPRDAALPADLPVPETSSPNTPDLTKVPH